MDPISGNLVMVLDDHDRMDESTEVAEVHPVDKSEQEELEPVATEFDRMRQRHLPLLPDLDAADEAISTWEIEGYRSLQQKARSPSFRCGGHSWNILLFPYGNNVDFVSLYLERAKEDDDADAVSPEGWSACVQFTLVMWNKSDPSMTIINTASHRFSAEEGDWGFTRFAEIRKLFAPKWEDRHRSMIENDGVSISAYVRAYEDPTGVLWHNFVNYNSKKETGMVGLKNQGATCYLNSLLQSLYFTNAFRKAIYQIPTDQESEKVKSAWALQRLFYLLQTNEEAVSTQELTLSFGWETKHIFEQQDVQELSRVLMERMEERMKGTKAENALPKMFVGKMKTYISCINVEYESSRIEDFWDIQLNVSGNKNLDDSFKDYIQVETMDGENKYYAEAYGLQDAKKGVIFESFPQVLHLQLKRFEYDLNRDAMMKVNDRYEFPEIFDASPYLSDAADKSEPYIYSLHSVLVHSGDFNAGHYYAFLRPSADGQFYKFDDDRVTRATGKEAMEENFGGNYSDKPNAAAVRNPYTRTFSTKRSMSAYMLVYIRQSRISNIIQNVDESDPPAHLAIQISEEKLAAERRKKDREEQHLYLTLGIVTTANFHAYQGFDLTDWDNDEDTPSKPYTNRVLRSSTIRELRASIADREGITAEDMRLWVMVNRQNKTIRPDQVLEDLDMTLETAYLKHGSRDKGFKLWAEQIKTEKGHEVNESESQQLSEADSPILIFLKHFDAMSQTLKGVGHVYAKKHMKVADLTPMIFKLMDWKLDEAETDDSVGDASKIIPLELYEEIKSSMIEPMKPRATLQAAEIQDGDIVCFQKRMGEQETSVVMHAGGYTDAREFYDHLLNRKIVSFVPRSADSACTESFKLELSRKMSYEQFSAKVGEHLKVKPTHLRFTTINSTTNKAKSVLRRTAGHNLNQILTAQFGTYGNGNQRDDALTYEILDISLSELDTKRTLKVMYIADDISKEEAMELLVPKLGTIQDVVKELQAKLNIDGEASAQLRIYEVQNGRIHREHVRAASLATITDYNTIVAELPSAEERDAAESDIEISCFQFDKDVTRTHGIPFKLWIKLGETFADTKIRLSKKMGIKGKQFEKVRVAVLQRSIYTKPRYLNDDDIISEIARIPDDLLGIDHMNRQKVTGARGDSIFIR